MGRGIKAGRVWVNNHLSRAFGIWRLQAIGHRASGIGRGTHKMMLDHYQQTKNMLVSYSPSRLGFL